MRRRVFGYHLFNSLAGLIGAWRSTPLAAEPLDSILQQLFGSNTFKSSDQIEVKIAELAEDGAIVPIHINCKLPDVRTISIVADNNPVPLVAHFHLHPPLRPVLGTRIKLAASTNVRIIVGTADGNYEKRKYVRVLQGGCDLPPVS